MTAIAARRADELAAYAAGEGTRWADAGAAPVADDEVVVAVEGRRRRRGRDTGSQRLAAGWGLGTVAAAMFNSALGRLRVVALVEGVSFLVLLFVAMPLKYAAGMPSAVKVVGSVHGGLFVLFLLALLQAWDERSWKLSRVVTAFVASVVPFGTFWFDRSLREEQARAVAVPAA